MDEAHDRYNYVVFFSFLDLSTQRIESGLLVNVCSFFFSGLRPSSLKCTTCSCVICTMCRHLPMVCAQGCCYLLGPLKQKVCYCYYLISEWMLSHCILSYEVMQCFTKICGGHSYYLFPTVVRMATQERTSWLLFEPFCLCIFTIIIANNIADRGIARKVDCSAYVYKQYHCP